MQGGKEKAVPGFKSSKVQRVTCRLQVFFELALVFCYNVGVLRGSGVIDENGQYIRKRCERT